MKKIKSYFWNILTPIIIVAGTILVILFSKGWRIDIKEKAVVNTGILDIISDPKGATLFLDGKNKGKTPIVIDSLPSGKYKAELRKDNYSSWQKEVEIAEGNVLKIETNLFDENTKLSQSSDIVLEKIIFSESGGEALLVSLRNGNQGIWKVKLDPSVLFLKKSLTKIANLYEPGFYDLLKSDYDINISPNFTKAIITIRESDDSPKRSFLFNLLSLESEFKEVSEFLITTDIKWSKNDKYVLFGTDSSLYSLNTETFEKSIITERNFENLWTLSYDKIYFAYFDPINNSNSIFSANFDGTKREKIIIDDFSINETSLIWINSEYETLLMNDKAAIYKFDLKSKEIQKIFDDSNVTFVNISPNQRYLLFKQNDENNFFTYDFEYSKLSDPFDIPTKNLIWTPNSLKLFYRYTNQEGINILGSVDPDGSNEYELLKLEDYGGLLEKEFGFSSDSRKVYLPLLSNYVEEQNSTNNEKLEEVILFEIGLR